MAAKSETLFIRACSTGKPDVVQDLLDKGLSPNTTDKYGLTGLIWSARKNQIEVAKVLLNGGADLEGKDHRGRTALSHAVALKRHGFVQLIIERGAFLNSADAHGWTALDLASMPLNREMVDLLKRHGAQRKATAEPEPKHKERKNRFYSGGAIGGPDLPVEVQRIHVQLNCLMHEWKGDYTEAVEFFAFPLFVDASVVRYTQQMNIIGGQKAKRKRNWLEARIGVPQEWWRDEESAYKRRLTAAIEEGLHSMISLLERNKHAIKEDLLLADWERVKKEFLDTSAPAFPAEAQQARMAVLVNEVKHAYEERKKAAPSSV